MARDLGAVHIGSLAGLYGEGPRALAEDLLQQLPGHLGYRPAPAREIKRYIAPGWSASSAGPGGSIPHSTCSVPPPVPGRRIVLRSLEGADLLPGSTCQPAASKA